MVASSWSGRSRRAGGGVCAPRPCAAISRAAASGSVAATHLIPPLHFGQVLQICLEQMLRPEPRLSVEASVRRVVTAWVTLPDAPPVAPAGTAETRVFPVAELLLDPD